jgi:hypothetical protein
MEVAVIIMNKQSWTADRGGLSAWVLGKQLTTPHHKNSSFLQNVTQVFGLGWVL